MTRQLPASPRPRGTARAGGSSGARGRGAAAVAARAAGERTNPPGPGSRFSALSEAFEANQGRQRTFSVPLDYAALLGLQDRRATRAEVVAGHKRAIVRDLGTVNATKYVLPGAFARGARLPSGAGEGFYGRATLEGRVRLLDAAKEAVLAQGGSPGPKAVSLPIAWLPGALAALHEVGDYESCVLAGERLLGEGTGLVEIAGARTFRRDALLSMALSRWELARNCLVHESRVATACLHLSKAQRYLRDAGRPPIIPGLEQDIDRLLERLVARCTLEHLSLPLDLEHAQVRRQAVSVFRQLLKSPSAVAVEVTGGGGGCVSPEYVRAGLRALTSTEVVGLLDWASVLDDPPAWFEPVFVHHAAIALVARAFLDREPRRLLKAARLLSALGERCEVDTQAGLAICSLLTRNATAALEILAEAEARVPDTPSTSGVVENVRPQKTRKPSEVPTQSYEAMEFVRQYSPKLSDLPPDTAIMKGLCTYAETWLEAEALERFRDTKNESASLEKYFASPEVEGYAPSALLMGVSSAASGLKSLLRGWVGPPAAGSAVQARVEPAAPPKRAAEGEQAVDRNGAPEGDLGFVEAEASSEGGDGGGSSLDLSDPSSWPWWARQGSALALLSLSLILMGNGLKLGAFRGGTARMPSAARRNPGERAEADASGSATLTLVQAERLVRTWQRAKAVALSQQYDTGPMQKVLSGQMLSLWRDKALKSSVEGCYWQYKLKSLYVRNVKVSEYGGVLTASINTELDEEGKFMYRNGRKGSSYSGPYSVRYTAQMFEDGQWRLVRGDIIQTGRKTL